MKYIEYWNIKFQKQSASNSSKLLVKVNKQVAKDSNQIPSMSGFILSIFETSFVWNSSGRFAEILWLTEKHYRNNCTINHRWTSDFVRQLARLNALLEFHARLQPIYCGDKDLCKRNNLLDYDIRSEEIHVNEYYNFQSRKRLFISTNGYGRNQFD